MKKSTSVIVLVAALIIQSCAGIFPMGANGSAALDSVNTAGNNPVGRSNTPGTFRTGIYSQSSLATTATANTTGPSLSPEELAANSDPSAGSTKRFITQVSLNNQSEVKLSTLALSRTKNSMVKSYAAVLLNNHEGMDKELKEMAVSKKVALSGSDAEEINKKMTELDNLSDDQFDKEYMKMIIKDHRNAADLFKQGTGLADPSVKAYSAKYLSIVKDQIRDASSLRSKLR